jgi:hypothetical protein
MTTGQSLLLPAQAPGQKPTPFMNREFELQYHIEYQPPASVVAGGTVVANAGVASGGPGATTGGVATSGATGGTTVAGGRTIVASGILGHTAGIKDVTVVTPCTKI